MAFLKLNPSKISIKWNFEAQTFRFFSQKVSNNMVPSKKMGHVRYMNTVQIIYAHRTVYI